VDAIRHLLPFHISASGTKPTVSPRTPLAVYPTATQAVADVHETPANCVTVEPLAAAAGAASIALEAVKRHAAEITSPRRM